MKYCCECIEEFKVSGIWDENTTFKAARYGHLECLIYARENGCPWSPYTTSNAARYGHLECLKYAHENGCPWEQRTTSLASMNGQFDCLKYAHENGCSWSPYTTSNTAKNGHFDCLKYALENGCPWHPYTLSNLEEHASKINIDDKWWRSVLFEKDLTSQLKLRMLVDTKKEEIKRVQEETTLLFSYISKDITQYIVWTYF